MSETAALRLEGAGLRGQALRIVRDHSYLVGYVALYVLAGVVMAWAFGLGDWMSLSLYSEGVWWLYTIWTMAFGLGYPVYVMLFVRPKRLTRYMYDDLRSNYFTFERLFAALIVLALVPAFTSVFTSFKIMIPLVNAYSWDDTFIAWDRFLHFGMDPWELLQPLLGYPVVTTIVNSVYHLWYFVLYGMIFGMAFATGRHFLRMRFLLTFVVTWSLLGSGAATWLSSVGPCFYGAILGKPDPFAPLMGYLVLADGETSVMALKVQRMLLDGYFLEVVERGRGISAMPSMHVSAAVLFALAGWGLGRVPGILLTAFAVFTQIGSIHLAYHYAVDGYVAAIATIAAWWAVGWLLRRLPGYRPGDEAATERRPVPSGRAAPQTA